MDKLYEFFLQDTELWQNDQYSWLPNYFGAEGGAVSAFLIAVLSALGFSAIFYLIFGRNSKLGSNFWIWLVCLILGMLTTWLVTDIQVIGSEDALSGLYGSIDEHIQTVDMPNAGSATDAVENLNQVQRTVFTELKDGCAFTLILGVMGAFISGIFYFLFSLVFKRMSRLAPYSINVPF